MTFISYRIIKCKNLEASRKTHDIGEHFILQ